MNAKTAIRSAAACVVSSVLVACSSEPPSTEPTGGPPVAVQTVSAALARVPVTTSAVGTTEPFARATTGTRLMGRVAEVRVNEGDRVKKGQVLVRVESGDLSARERQAESGLAEARAVLANASANVVRTRNLYNERAVAKSRLDEAETAFARAQAAVASAEGAVQEVRANIGYSAVESPLDGVVARKFVQPGDMTAPGVPLVFVEQQDPMRVVVEVSESEIGAVRVGETVPVDIEVAGERRGRSGRVEAIVPSADAASRTFQVKVLLENEDEAIRSGVFARVHFPKGDRPGILVPETAVTRSGQLEGVFVVSGERARLRWVRLGKPLGDQREVISGLAAGEVVVRDAEGVADGRAVAVGR